MPLFTTHHEIEPELRDGPRLRFRVSGSVLWRRRLVCNALLAALCVVCFFGSREIHDLSLLSSKGQVAWVYVTGNDQLASLPFPDCYRFRVYLSFRENSGERDASFETDGYDSARLKFGQKVPITWLAENRSICRHGFVRFRDVINRVWHWLGIALLVAIPFGLDLWADASLVRQRQRQLTRGIPAVATVISRRKFEPGPDESGALQHYVSYTYALPGGKPVCGEAPVERRIYDTVRAGVQFTVLVSDRDDRQSEPYFGITDVRIDGAPERHFV